MVSSYKWNTIVETTNVTFLIYSKLNLYCTSVFYNIYMFSVFSNAGITLKKRFAKVGNNVVMIVHHDAERLPEDQ